MVPQALKIQEPHIMLLKIWQYWRDLWMAKIDFSKYLKSVSWQAIDPNLKTWNGIYTKNT